MVVAADSVVEAAEVAGAGGAAVGAPVLVDLVPVIMESRRCTATNSACMAVILQFGVRNHIGINGIRVGAPGALGLDLIIGIHGIADGLAGGLHGCRPDWHSPCTLTAQTCHRR